MNKTTIFDNSFDEINFPRGDSFEKTVQSMPV